MMTWDEILAVREYRALTDEELQALLNDEQAEEPDA